MCKSSRDSKDSYFFSFFCPFSFHSVDLVLLILAFFFFLPFAVRMILHVLDLVLGTVYLPKEDTNMHRDGALV